MTKKVKQVCDLLEENGFEFVRIRGDHRIYRKDKVGIVVIPGNLGDDLATGTFNSILRKAGLK